MNQIFCICQILEIKLEYNERVYQLCVDFKTACVLGVREVLYNIIMCMSDYRQGLDWWFDLLNTCMHNSQQVTMTASEV
jgi:hypothetical protein